jgi:alpha-glucosidase
VYWYLCTVLGRPTGWEAGVTERRRAAGVGARFSRRAATLIAASALLLAACPAVAAASTTLGSEQIIVQGPDAGAVITRAPFQISFTDAVGNTVLSEAPTQGSGFTLPATLPGVQSAPGSTALFAPLSFLVGSDQPATYTAFSNAGNLLSDEETGTEYSAREVLAASPYGDGVELTVSTDDPSGRQLSVRVVPDGAGAIRVSARPLDATGVAAMADSFSSSPQEAFHGFGGRHNSLDQRGQDFYNWVDQENSGTGPQENPGETNLSPDGPQAAYYVQSSFVSNDGYGFLLDQNELSRWRMDSGEEPDIWQSEVAAPEIDYVVAPGDMAQAIATLTSITGRQRTPPTWGLGPMFDREVELFEHASQYEQQIESDLHEITADKLPVEAYRIEGWAFLSKPFLESVIARLKALGIRPLVYFRSFVADEELGTEYSTEYDEALQNGYVASTEGGQPYVFQDNFLNDAAVIDFTNPNAVSWWRKRLDAALDLGAEGFMLDFGEQVQPGMHFSDGSTGDQMHNRYPVLAEKVTREAIEAYEAEHPGRSIVFFTRSGYSGEPGSAAYENFNFPGDETTNWSQASGLASLTRDMLNRAIGGAYGYGTDIGGYEGAEPTTRELFVRWAEWAALSPVFRLHGALGEEHTPWDPKINAVAVYKQLSELHISVEPYISALWKQADETGIPITRPLYLAYPDDPQAALQDQEWLLGPDVLVAPIVEKGATGRTAYFPAGCWRDPETGQQVLGPRYETVAADLDQLPFFFTCGTAPFSPPSEYSSGQTYTKALAVSTTSLASGRVGTRYFQNMAANGGVTPFVRWSVTAGTLPSGLSLDAQTGAIVGAPNAPGVSTFTVEVTDSSTPTPTSATAGLSITVLPAEEGAAEYGQCVALAKGRYTEGDCLTKSAKARRGRYEWVPAPTSICVRRKGGQYKSSSCATRRRHGRLGRWEKDAFPRYVSRTGPVTLEAAEGVEVVCAASSGVQEITGRKTGNETITLTGCESSGRDCTSEGPNSVPSGSAGVIDTSVLTVRLIEPSSGEVFTELESSPRYPYSSEFSCGGQIFRTMGAMVGAQAGNINVPSVSSTTTFGLSEGEQALYSELSTDGGATWAAPAASTEVAVASNTSTVPTEIKT